MNWTRDAAERSSYLLGIPSVAKYQCVCSVYNNVVNVTETAWHVCDLTGLPFIQLFIIRSARFCTGTHIKFM